MRELNEENFPHFNKPPISSEGLTIDEIKRLVNLGQRFRPFSDEHRAAIWEQINALHEETWQETRKLYARMKEEEPEYYAEFVKMLAEQSIDAPV